MSEQYQQFWRQAFMLALAGTAAGVVAAEVDVEALANGSDLGDLQDGIVRFAAGLADRARDVVEFGAGEMAE